MSAPYEEKRLQERLRLAADVSELLREGKDPWPRVHADFENMIKDSEGLKFLLQIFRTLEMRECDRTGPDARGALSGQGAAA
jgi:hypothetical protein